MLDTTARVRFSLITGDELKANKHKQKASRGEAGVVWHAGVWEAAERVLVAREQAGFSGHQLQGYEDPLWGTSVL